MYCQKCGSKLPEMANFCEKCGIQINGNNSTIKSKEILFKVKPTFKFTYLAMFRIVKPLIYFVILVVVALLIINLGIEEANKFEISSLSMYEFIPMLVILLGIPLIGLIVSIIKMFFDRRQYENYEYVFFNDRIVYKDGYLNVSEKELRYLNVKEIAKRQTFIQRVFNIGNIILFSSAENGISSGIYMENIENVDDVYTKIKEIINV